MTFEDDTPTPRKPRVFKADDVTEETEFDDDIACGGAVTARRSGVPARALTVNDINRGFRFGGILSLRHGCPGLAGGGPVVHPLRLGCARAPGLGRLGRLRTADDYRPCAPRHRAA